MLWATAADQKVLDFVPSHEEAIVGSLLSQMEFESLEELSNETEFFQNERAYKYLCEFASKELKEKFKGLAEQIMQNNIQQLSSSLENGAFNHADIPACAVLGKKVFQRVFREEKQVQIGTLGSDNPTMEHRIDIIRPTLKSTDFQIAIDQGLQNGAGNGGFTATTVCPGKNNSGN